MHMFRRCHSLYDHGPQSSAGRRLGQNRDFGFVIDVEQYNSTKLAPVELKRVRKGEAGAPHRRRAQAVSCSHRRLGLGLQIVLPGGTATAAPLPISFAQATMGDIAAASAADHRPKPTKEMGIFVKPNPHEDARVVGISDCSFDTDGEWCVLVRLPCRHGAKGVVPQRSGAVQYHVLAEPQD